VSYGTLNNDSTKVKLQVKQGIDAVIVDSVLAIRIGLTGPDRKTDALQAIGNGGEKGSTLTGRSLEKNLTGSTESLEILVPAVAVETTDEPDEIGVEVQR